MQKTFETIDTDKSGTINFGEFGEALREIDFRFTNEEIKV